MYYVYILKSDKTGQYYIGSTSNIEARIKRHNKGEVKSTKGGIPWVLKYFESHKSLSLARKREMQIKNWKKREMIDKLINKRRVRLVD